MARKMTPMMKQYMDVKSKHPDKFVLFRMGDFYELFFDDAKNASRILDIALTSREKSEDPVPMAGVPHHSVESYLKKLVNNGHKVVICDQVEDASEAKGLVKREVTRIITPGTYFSETDANEGENIFLASVCVNSTVTGISFVDLSTGEFYADTCSRREALEELRKIGVNECLIPSDGGEAYTDFVSDLGTAKVTETPEWSYSFDTARTVLLEHFNTASLAGFGFDEQSDYASIRAAGAAMHYLRETQKNALSHIVTVRHLIRDDHLHIDLASQTSLELIRTERGGDKRNSLFGVLDFTRTPMGRRKLRQWLIKPLTDCRTIYSRQEGVRELKEDAFLSAEVKEILSGIYDLERLASKISSGRCTARDLVHLKNSLKHVRALREAMANVHSETLQEAAGRIKQDGYVIDSIEKRIVEDPPLQITEGGIIRDGVDSELDELRSISKDGKTWIGEYQQKERKRSGIEKLKIGYNKVFGYYIEVTNLYKDRVPEDYIRKQTLTNSERFFTPELKEYEQKVISAEEKIGTIEYSLFQDTRDLVKERINEILDIAGGISEIDVLYALGYAAASYGYRAPVVDESTAVEIRDGCHPVLLRNMPEGEFVPNDLFVDAEQDEFLIITGPNMSGKSTYIRQAAVLVIMAQIGSFIPAKKARIGVVDRIFTRIGASDEISRGHSTFMVEMTEVANILNNASSRSLIVLDEVGRGTSTFDGVSIAWAVAEYIMNTIGARTLFATHYHELTELVMTSQNAKNLNVSVREWNGEVVFLHKIVEGSADKSYGIHVADIAGIPAQVVERSREILENLELGSIDEHHLPKLAEHREDTEEPVQLSIFDLKNEKVLRQLREIDVNAITPLEALNTLDRLSREVE